MPAKKMVYVSEGAHQRLKMLAAQRKQPMGEVVEALVDEELANVASPWTTSAGLRLQEHALAAVWDDPALDVYDDD